MAQVPPILTKVLITLFVGFILFYLTFTLLATLWPNSRTSTPLTTVLKDAISLNQSTPQSIATSDQFITPFFNGPGGSIIFYLNLTPGQRTENIQQPYSQILGADGTISLQIPTAPGSGRAQTGEAKIVVWTTKSSEEIVQEEIPLPPLPYQSWVQVAILREGRRYDVLYNGKAVSSKRLRWIPAIRLSPLLAGSPDILGSIAQVQVAAHRLYTVEIAADYKNTSDTRGMPTGVNLNIVVPSATAACLPGMPCATTGTPIAPPDSPLITWESPYS